MRIFSLCLLLSALVGCGSHQPDTASTTTPPDVVAVRGDSGPSASQPNNIVTQTIAQDITAMKKAQSVAAEANKKIAADQNHADNIGQ